MSIDKMFRILPLLALLAAAQTLQIPTSTADPAGGEEDLVLTPRHLTTPKPDTRGTTVKYAACVTEKNEEGECVPYYLCDKNGTIIQDGGGIIDIRLNDRLCAHYLEICCVLADKRKPDNPITPAPPAEPREGCGWRNPDGVGLRLKGAMAGEANYAEFPWMVAVLRIYGWIEPLHLNDRHGFKTEVYLGGGSLIHPSVVLTAAHYVARVTRGGTLTIRAGEWDTQTRREPHPYQDRDVKKVVVHKDFNDAAGNLNYDIALLFLSSPVAAAPNVGVACLPSAGARAAAGTRCLASGWGKDVFGKHGHPQAILKKVELPVVERARCEQQLQSTRLGAHFMLHSSFMCAGGERGVDTCTGDGGSPLVCPAEYETDRYVQYGIVAGGIECGGDWPGMYVDVGKFRDWIDNEVRREDYNPAYYTLPYPSPRRQLSAFS